MHAYANPAHERQIGEILRARLPTLFVTLSHEILREYREYERTSTTALNAYVGPRVQAYLRRLESYLRKERFGGKITIMRSNGGVMSISLAQEQPVSMMESGPGRRHDRRRTAGRADGHRTLHRLRHGRNHREDEPHHQRRAAIEDGYVIGGAASGQPMQLPVVDIVEVGAGGGSIAWTTRPAAFMSGRRAPAPIRARPVTARALTDPVVTDADLVLGRINAGVSSTAR